MPVHYSSKTLRFKYAWLKYHVGHWHLSHAELIKSEVIAEGKNRPLISNFTLKIFNHWTRWVMRQNVQYLKYFSISRFVWTKFKLLIIRCIYSDGRAREIHRKDITELSSLTLVSALNSQSPAGDRSSDFSSRSASPGDWGRDLGAVTERPRPRGTRLTSEKD